MQNIAKSKLTIRKLKRTPSLLPRDTLFTGRHLNKVETTFALSFKDEILRISRARLRPRSLPIPQMLSPRQ
jgi:hypothetical protein